MAASSTWEPHVVSNIVLLSARCTGFARIKGSNDYTYIIDLTWSDERSMSVKRTYAEFTTFHRNLLKVFPELRHTEGSDLKLQTSLKENVANLFVKDKRSLTEAREGILDFYLRGLLKLPDRIRESNIVLSFFKPRDSDPKPCKNSAPSEKSDSGIDLSLDKPNHHVRRLTQEIGTQHDNLDRQCSQNSLDNHYLDQSCGVGVSVRNATPHSKRCRSTNQHSSGEYDGDSSETPSEDDDFEDYFLDVGYGELLLREEYDSTERSNQSPETSMWCSNLNTFSNILKTNLDRRSSDLASLQYKALTSICDIEQNTFTNCVRNGDFFLTTMNTAMEKECSDTESQAAARDACSDDLESDDEFVCKPLPKADMNHYILSSSDTTLVE